MLLALPLFVAALHAVLAIGALASGAGRRRHQLVAALAGVMSLAALGVFQIRHATDPDGGLLGHRVLNLTFALTPAVYYHLVRVVTGTAEAVRAAIVMAYGGATLFTAVALFEPGLLVRDVVRTTSEWAPVTGPLGLVLFVFYLAVLVATLRPLLRARHRALLASSLIMLLAPLANFAAVFLVQARALPVQMPPLRLPSSVVVIALVWFATRENAT